MSVGDPFVGVPGQKALVDAEQTALGQQKRRPSLGTWNEELWGISSVDEARGLYVNDSGLAPSISDHASTIKGDKSQALEILDREHSTHSLTVPANGGTVEMQEVYVAPPKKEEIVVDEVPRKWWQRKPVEKKEQDPRVGFSGLFRFADSNDKLLYLIGSICAIIQGAGLPVTTIFMGDLVLALVSYNPICNEPGFILPPGYPPCDLNSLTAAINKGVLGYVIVGCIVFVCAYLSMVCFMIAGERQAKRIRERYFESILRQDIGWFDGNQTGELTSRMIADTNLVQDGLSDKVAMILQNVATFVSGFVIAFVRGWQLALVLCVVFPVLGAGAAFMSKVLASRATAGQDSYAKAGAVAEQTISSIRTVVAFGNEERQIGKYNEALEQGLQQGKKQTLTTAVGIGVMMFVIFACYALAFWYGSILIEQGLYNAGQVLNVFFAVMIGAFSIGGMAPNVSSVGTAMGAAYKLFATIDRKSPIDPLDPSGVRLDKVVGNVEFKNIEFTYPSRPDVPILGGEGKKAFNLSVPAGATVALVGGSGSGKSTIVKLLERMYDPQSGQVFLDGVDIKTLNVQWLRAQIGIVSQEPVLFDTTVKKNILMGLNSTEGFSADELDLMVVKAAKQANAHDFIMNMPRGYDTGVGERGTMMSGGQKQRIAIARAIISNPKILLLDEATSALDTQSERVVQNALDSASQGRTAIVIAHRLSTIKNANLIVVMQHGEIVESGTHDQLLQKGGIYYELVQAQSLKQLEKQRRKTMGTLESPVQSGLEMSGGGVTPERLAMASMEGEDDDQLDIDTLDRMTSPGATLKRMQINRIATADLQKQLDEEKKKQLDAELEKYKKQPAPWGRLARLNSPEWMYICIGLIAAAVNGVIMPLFSVIFAKILNVFAPGNPNLREEANFYAGLFVALGAVQMVCQFAQISCFGISGELMTKRLRLGCFSALLHQEIGFFDEDKNSTGALTTKLADEATQVKGLTGQLMGSLLSMGITLIAGIVIAFVNAWNLALVVLATMPLVAISGILRMRALTGFNTKTKEMYEQAGQVANEAMDNVRTVATLNKEEYFIDRYKQDILVPHQYSLKSALVTSLGQGFSQAALFFVYALAFWVGGTWVGQQVITSTQCQTTMFALVFSFSQAAQISSFVGNISKARVSSLAIFDLMDRQSKIDARIQGGFVGQVNGEVDVTGVEFKYPTRDEMILRGLDLQVRPGETVALVGPSGCGKSTTIALVERWYDVLTGRVMVEGVDVREWNLKSLRAGMALVGQEPVLFPESIASNIASGKPDGSGVATMEEIEVAARAANIHNFVMTLPDGYQTDVGSKGTLLSGGQKQRVAIARALIRNPRLLLLDEATSALDSESEKVVQLALDEASKSRSTISIAHRLATIQDADRIYVFNKGVVVESGKHLDLLREGGMYSELCAQQGLGVQNT